MNPDEQLLHQFYLGNTSALDELARRFDPILARVAFQILLCQEVDRHLGLRPPF